MLRKIVVVLARCFFKIYLKVEVINCERFEKLKSGCIVTPNHISAWETVIVPACTKRVMYMMAKEEMFKNKFLAKVCSRNGLPKATVHGLRHMYATILIEQGVSIAKISALLGHSSVHTTFDFYCDVMSEKEKMIAYMNNTFCISEEEELE